MKNIEQKKSEFGKLLARFRKQAGLSQNELAVLIEMSPTHISKIEQGNRNPLRRKSLWKVVNALNLSPDEEIQLYSAAGYSTRSYTSSVYSSPYDARTSSKVRVEKEKRGSIDLNNPAVRLVAKVLNDPEIPIGERLELESQVISFVEWLRDKKLISKKKRT